MLIGTNDLQNVFAVVAGVPFIIAGVAIIAKRVGLARVMSDAQSRFGAAGRRVARENKPWVYVTAGVICVVLAVLLVLAGLFAHFSPSGTPR